jgi:hypothetical protein
VVRVAEWLEDGRVELGACPVHALVATKTTIARRVFTAV